MSPEGVWSLPAAISAVGSGLDRGVFSASAIPRKGPVPTVLGGDGLIGTACCRAPSEAGFRVIGLGRSPRAATTTAPEQEWIY